MASFQNYICVGNLCNDPQVKYLEDKKAIAEFSIAINEGWFDKAENQRKESVLFLNCVAFGRTAEVAGEFCKKGSPILVHGRLKEDRWTDKETGQQRSKMKVVCDSIKLLGSKND